MAQDMCKEKSPKMAQDVCKEKSPKAAQETVDEESKSPKEDVGEILGENVDQVSV